MSFNKAIIVGNLGKDPESKDVNGKTVCTLSVATTSGDHTEWHHVEAWEKVGENCFKYLEKGKRVLVEGRIKTDTWEKDGQKHSRTKIVAHSVQFLSPKSEGDGIGGIPS